MLQHQHYERDDGWALDLARSQAWATLVSPPTVPGGELVVSHLPIVVDDVPGQTVILGHLGNPDQEYHDLGRHRVTLVVQGVNGYISPSWYTGGPYVPTWNFEVAHFHGVPEVLDAEATYDVLRRTCDHLESFRAVPWQLDSVQEYAERIAVYTTGFRLVADRVVAKAKLSQDKPVEDVRSVMAALVDDPHQANPALADAMRRVHG